MKTWKKTVLAVSGGLIGVGAICAGIGIARGGSINYGINLKAGYIDYNAERDQTERTIDQLGTFDQLHIQLDSADIRILQTKEKNPYIQTNLGENRLQWSVEEGTLSIQEVQQTGIYGFSFNPPFLGLGSGSVSQENDVLTLYIPRSMYLKDSTVRCDYGDVDVSQISCEQMEFAADSGRISLKKLGCDTISLKADYGNVSLEDVSAGSLSISQDSGNYTGRNVEADELTLSSSYGQVELEEGRIKTGSITIDSGNLLMSQLQVKECLDVKSDYGDITFESKEGVDAYSYELAADYGTVTVGEKTYASSIIMEKENAPVLSFCADSGDITVK